MSPNAPLWLNPTLEHFYSLPDPYAWTHFKIKTVTQIILDKSLISFSQLISDFNIPQSYSFRFLQLSHAFSCQFSGSPLQLVQSALEKLLRLDCTKNAASKLYLHLTTVSLPNLEKLRSKWSKDIPELNEDDLDNIWDSPFNSLVSLRDRLIQFKIGHRAYYTPHIINKINSDSAPGCW